MKFKKKKLKNEIDDYINKLESTLLLLRKIIIKL